MKINYKIGLMLVFSVLLLTNHVLVMDLHAQLQEDTNQSSIEKNGEKATNTNSVAPPAITDKKVKEVYSKVIPSGVPALYGSVLGVSFDKGAEAVKILESYDRGSNKITLTGETLQRYIDIGSRTACEYCCGAKTLVFKDGQPACGCAHSAAMRGLATYLLQNHGTTMSNDQILEEVNKWKAVFFPKNTVEKALSLSNNGNIDMKELNKLSPQVGGC